MSRLTTIAILSLFPLFLSCKKESYVIMDKSNFIKYLDSVDTPKEPSDLLNLYYFEFLGNPRPIMSKTTYESRKENENEKISFVQYQQDDSISAIKFTIVFKKKAQNFEIVEIRKSFSCHKGRGHTNFGIENCN